jgi:hypothetical protein
MDKEDALRCFRRGAQLGDGMSLEFLEEIGRVTA